MTINVLFLCPHNAAKSVAAAAYADRMGGEQGLDIAVSTAGTDPDEAVLPIVRAQLESDGYRVDSVPRLVTAGDLADADHIVNIGCAHSDLPTDRQPIDWSIPNFSDDPAVAFAALEQHVADFVQSLSGGHVDGDSRLSAE